MDVFGTLLTGIGTIVIAIVSVLAIFSFSRWRREKIIEKKSSIAEETLEYFESSIAHINQWLLFATSWEIFSKFSPENQTKLHRLSEGEQKQFEKACNEDPFEVINFCRTFQQDLSNFIKAKNRAFHLNEIIINEHFTKLWTILKALPSKVMRLHRINFPEKEKNATREYLENKASEEIEKNAEEIRKLLIERLHFKI